MRYLSSAFLCLVVVGLASCGGDSLAPTEAPSPPDLTLHIEGTVLDVDQQPRPNAEVVLYSKSCSYLLGYLVGCSTSALDSTQTGPTGRYSLVVPSYCGGTMYVQATYGRVPSFQAGKTGVRCIDSVQQRDIQLCRARPVSGSVYACLP